MKFRTILSLATLFLACFTVAVWSQPLPAAGNAPGSGSRPENQSVSGKISAVGDAEFSVQVAKGGGEPQTVRFLVDDKTRVEGKLAVGAQAQVEYRSDAGANIAIHVVVSQSTGVRH